MAATVRRGLDPQQDDEEIARRILQAIREIRHGAVHVIVQDARVVQIDKIEKQRLT